MSSSASIQTTIPGVAHPTEARTGSVRAAAHRNRIWTVGLAAGVTAAVATTLSAVVARTFGEDIAIDGEQIPLSGFAMLTVIGALFGTAIAKLSLRTGRPRTVFIRVTVTLTAVSLIPDLVADAPWGSRLTLAATHVIAAAIIIPALAHRLAP